MHIASPPYLLLLLWLVSSVRALRAQRASRKSLAHLKQVLNDEVARSISARQNDEVDIFGDFTKNPDARRNQDELLVNNPEDYFQGDVDLSEQQVKLIEKSFSDGHREKRKVGRTPLYRLWDRTRAISFDFAETVPRRTRAKIRYPDISDYAKHVLSKHGHVFARPSRTKCKMKDVVRKTLILPREAMDLWQRNTCVRFDENGPSVDRLEFFDGGGCSSFVGRIGGTQRKRSGTFEADVPPTQLVPD
ncbi:astacin [Ancylostoma ceylanicum]|uniref:Astacin n=1 Tax=Ancylostoma ceylanicum TaxID=53326 RepID=A0A0D6LRC6_9BILA|nr:astacin [Ancylostoma ceylanicum]